MPAFNEEATIEATIRECLEIARREHLHAEVVVANDGSLDGTRDILKRLEQAHEAVRLVDLPENVGYGGALSQAIRASTGTYVVTVDSDGQFDPADMVRLLARIREGYDCVTGYRTRKKDTLPRVVANWGYNLLVRLLCGVAFKDAQCALKVYRGDLIRSLPMEARGFTFPTEALVKLRYCGHRIAEMPITHRFREGGASKVRFFQTIRIMFIFLLYIRFKLALHKNRIIHHL